MRRTTLLLPEDLVDRARRRYGARGLGPRVRELLEADLDDSAGGSAQEPATDQDLYPGPEERRSDCCGAMTYRDGKRDRCALCRR